MLEDLESKDFKDLKLIHIASKGETIEDIAFMYETKAADIIQWNPSIEEYINDLEGKKILVSDFPSYFLSKANSLAYYSPGKKIVLPVNAPRFVDVNGVCYYRTDDTSPDIQKDYNGDYLNCEECQKQNFTPTPTLTKSATPTASITPTPTLTKSATPTASITPTPTLTKSATPTASITPTPTLTKSSNRIDYSYSNFNKISDSNRIDYSYSNFNKISDSNRIDYSYSNFKYSRHSYTNHNIDLRMDC